MTIQTGAGSKAELPCRPECHFYGWGVFRQLEAERPSSGWGVMSPFIAATGELAVLPSLSFTTKITLIHSGVAPAGRIYFPVKTPAKYRSSDST